MKIFFKITALLTAASIQVVLAQWGLKAAVPYERSFIAGTGYSIVTGSFKETLDMGYNLHLGFDSPYSKYGQNLRYETCFDYSSLNVSSNENSVFEIYGVRVGLRYLYELNYGFSLTAYAGPEFSLIQYISDGLDTTNRYMRPGISAGGGIDWRHPSGFGFRPEIRYRGVPFSGGSLNEITFFSAATFRAESYTVWMGNRQRVPSDPGDLNSYERAESYYRNGQFREAKSAAVKLNLENSSDPRVGGLLSRIEEHENTYASAIKNINTGRKIEALPLLENALPMSEAAGKLEELKTELSPRIPGFERAGIKAYNEMNYDQCIYYMNIIRSIDPGNKTVRLYLPRAEQRKKAQLKLN